MDTQKATTTNQMNDSVNQDPKNIQEDNEKGDIELKKKNDQPAQDTGRGVETDRPMVTAE